MTAPSAFWPALRLLAVLLLAWLLGLPGLAAQEPPAEPEPPSLHDLVWTALEDQADKEALKALKARKPSLEDVLAILDAGPPRAVPQAGVHRREGFAVPGEDVTTHYLVRVPEGVAKGERLPLLLCIHGTGGRAEWALEEGRHGIGDGKVLLVAPAEAADIHGQGWGYRERERALILAVLDEVVRRYPVDRERVYVTGISRGGHASFDLGLRHAAEFAGVAPVSGAMPRRDLPLLPNMASLRVFALVGGRDQAALVEGAQRAFPEGAKSTQHRLRLEPERGHEAFRDLLPEALAFLFAHRRDPAPAAIHLRTREKAGARHDWLRIDKLGSKVWQPGRPVVLPVGTPRTEEGRLAAYDKVLEAGMPFVEARFEAERLVVTTRKVRRFEIFVPLSRRPASGKLEVVVDGKVVRRAERVPLPDGAELIALAREAGTTNPAHRFAKRLRLSARGK